MSVAFHDVSFSHGGAPVLASVSLEVAAGETLALVGRSGAGKSTLLKLVNRMLLPGAGRVEVAGRDTREWDPYALRRGIGYVLQETGLFPHQNVRANVALVPELLGWPRARVQDRVEALLDLVGLSPAEFGGRWPHELSGGQRQRVGLARALAADPPILLLDEPFGALDPITRHDVRQAFAGIQARLRKTVVLVTHDMREALRLGTRVGVLDRQRLIACAPPQALARDERPQVRALFEAADLR